MAVPISLEAPTTRACGGSTPPQWHRGLEVQSSRFSKSVSTTDATTEIASISRQLGRYTLMGSILSYPGSVAAMRQLATSPCVGLDVPPIAASVQESDAHRCSAPDTPDISSLASDEDPFNGQRVIVRSPGHAPITRAGVLS